MARFNDRTLPHLHLPARAPLFSAFPFHRPVPRPRREQVDVTWIVHDGLASQIQQRATPQLRECALHLLTMLAVQAKQRKDPDAYFALHSGILRTLYTSRFYGPMMRLLRELGAIECRANGRYVVGSSSRHYRLAKEFRAVTAIPDVSASVVARARLVFRRASFKVATTQPLRWIIKSYLRCSFSASVPEILETHVFRCSTSRLATLHTVGLVQRRDLEFHPDPQTGRVYYPVANLPKVLRRELLIDGSPTVEIDLAACQPTLLAMLYPHPTREQENYLSLVQSEDFYATIAKWAGKEWTRDEAKEAFFTQIAFSYASAWRRMPLYPHFVKRFPELAQQMAAWKARHKAALPLKMQSLEAKVIIQGVVNECAEKQIPVLPVHDSIICRCEQAAELEAVVKGHWDRVTGLPCRVRVQGRRVGE